MSQNNNLTEIFPLVDDEGRVIGSATRAHCHDGSMLLHPVVHLHVISPAQGVYLQKRSLKKDIQPGKWDTAVGGHVDYGESIPDAVRREAREELGLRSIDPVFIIRYKFRSDVECELVHTYYIEPGPDFAPTPDGDEVDEARFWSLDEIEASLGQGVFTPNFEMEFQRILPQIKLSVL